MNFNRGDMGIFNALTGFKFSRLKFYTSLLTYSIEHFTSFRVIALIFTVVISSNFLVNFNRGDIAVFSPSGEVSLQLFPVMLYEF